MRHERSELTLSSKGKGLFEFTSAVREFVAGQEMQNGLLSVFCMHTSCSLLIQENADPDVVADLNDFFERLVPENQPWFRHTTEGPDDMPAHIRTAVTQTSLAIPVAAGRPMLGTWQGIYLFEHRATPHRRRIILDLIGD